MIHKPTRILELFLTCLTMIHLPLLSHNDFHFLRTVNPYIMNDRVSFSKGRETAVVARAQEGLLFFLGPLRVLGLVMEIQCMFLEKSLITDLTHMAKLFLVALHMIKHRGLILFRGLASGAHKETLVVLRIGKCHSFDVGACH